MLKIEISNRSSQRKTLKCNAEATVYTIDMQLPNDIKNCCVLFVPFDKTQQSKMESPTDLRNTIFFFRFMHHKLQFIPSSTF